MNNSSGILLVDKPVGPSSNQVVSMVKKRFDCKVGHTGTLDPLASGVLVLLAGESTRISQYLSLADKKYETTIILGIETNTLDGEGKIIARNSVPDFKISQLDQKLDKLRGEITQIPPMYSALKHKGVPLYKLARQGKNIKRKPRQIKIYSLEIIDYKPPALQLKIHCSKGTYIRQLASDLGNILKTGAHVKSLRRNSCGDFTLEQTVNLEELKKMDQTTFLSKLLNPINGLNNLKGITVNQKQALEIYHGRKFRLDKDLFLSKQLVYIIDYNKNLLGFANYADGVFSPKKLFITNVKNYINKN
ncbi:MAG: tRNA pseudouridine(55) synthase TruB [Myxococcota bacterium]